MHIHASRTANRTLQAASNLRKRVQDESSRGCMTLAKLKDICRENGQPTCPMAVVKLDLNCQLFEDIGDCIEEYREMEELHLGRNRLTAVREGIRWSLFTHLKVLYLNNNSISSMSGLVGCNSLQVLSLSFNQVSAIQGLEHLPRLETLLLSDNRLTDQEAVCNLLECPSLAELDLSGNQARK